MKNIIMSFAILLCLALMAQSAHAVVLFQDDFENQSEVSSDTWQFQQDNPLWRVQADPDGWFVYGIGVGGDPPLHDLQITDNTTDPPGGAFAGNNSLRLVRSTGTNVTTAASFERQVDTIVHAEAMIYTPTTTEWQGAMFLTDNPADNQHGQGMLSGSSVVFWTGAGQIRISEASGNTYISLTTPLDRWVKWEMDVDLAAKTWVLTIDGVSSQTLGFLTAGQNAASGFVLWGAGPSTHIYADNVLVTPEPATLAILGLGGLFLRRRYAK